jgi:cytoskeletal protein RodZ
MKCKRFDDRPTLTGRLHRLRCKECRAAAQVDATIASGIQEMRGEMPPKDGLASVLSAVPLNANPVPGRGRRSLAPIAWVAGPAALLIAGFVLWQNNHTRSAVPPRDILRDEMASGSGTKEPHKLEPLKELSTPKRTNLDKHPTAIALTDRPAPKRPKSAPRQRHSRPSSAVRVAAVEKSYGKTVAETTTLLYDSNSQVPHETVSFSVDGDRTTSTANRSYVISSTGTSPQPILARSYVMGRVQLSSNSSNSLQGAPNPGRPRELQAW